MPVEIRDDDQLLDRIEKTVNYWNKHYADLERVAADLARKMGIDSNTDLVLLDHGWCLQRGLRLKDFPKWISVSNEINGRISIRRKVRKR